MKKIMYSFLLIFLSFLLFAESSPKNIPKAVAGNMIFIKGGEFKMGNNDGIIDEQPEHTVMVGDFYLSKYQVTVTDFESCIDATRYQTNADIKGGSYFWDGYEWVFKEDVNWKYSAKSEILIDSEKKHPVIHVSWYDAIFYCNWLSKKQGFQQVYQITQDTVTANWEANGYRLPTEAEWEYAAKSGGQEEKFAGTSLDSLVNMYGNYSEIDNSNKDGFIYTAPVGTFQPNKLGLYDMSGNVWEWCWDWFDAFYYDKGEGSINPQGPNKGLHKVQRGGSWKSTTHYLQCTFRGYFSPDDGDYSIGFRLARSSE